ncbi:MAG: Crp/Fnr family transcriptional regulator [Flavobacteriales bacterium]|nr:Crp/Fnr family transcriptional regulator [Flavobacteriales bacterium]
MSARDLLRANVQKRIMPSEKGLEFFMSLGEERKFRKRDKMLEAGELARFEAFITKGCVRMYYTDARQHDHNVLFGFEDWWVCDLISFYTGAPAHHSIEALEDTTAICYKYDDIESVLNHYPEFERYFRLLMQKAYIAGQQRIISSLSKSAEERYIDLVTKFPQLEHRVAQHHIASYIGISPEALSRIKRSMIERARSGERS